MIKTVDNTYSDFCENIEKYFKDSDDVIVENSIATEPIRLHRRIIQKL